MKAMELKRNSFMVKHLADNRIEVYAHCQISAIKRTPHYTNIAIQDINFEFNGKEYSMDHVWLQERDYPEYMLDEGEAVLNDWYEIYFEFYPYRDKTETNEYGVPMHGIEVFEMNPIEK